MSCPVTHLIVAYVVGFITGAVSMTVLYAWYLKRLLKRSLNSLMEEPLI